MTSLAQLPPNQPIEMVAGNPFTLTIVCTGATITAGAIDILASVGVASTVIAPTVTTNASTIVVPFTVSDSAALQALTGVSSKKTMRFSVSGLVNGVGPFELLGGPLIVHPVGTTGVATSATANLSVTAGGATVALAVNVGGAANAAGLAFTPAAGISATNVQAAIVELVADSSSQYQAKTTWPHLPTKAIRRSLALGVHPVAMAVYGDSLGTSSTRWAYLFALWLGAEHPAYTVHYRLWDQTSDGWGTLGVLSTGTAGEAYLTCDGSTARSFTCPDSARVSPTGDISIRCKVQPTGSWASGTQQTLLAKFGAAGQRTFRFQLNSDGRLFLDHSADGTNMINKYSTANTTTVFSSGQAGWVRVDLDVDNGAAGNTATFYTSSNGTSWTQLGSAATTAGTTSLFDSTTGLEVGARQSTLELVNGNLYAAELWSGIGANPLLLAAWYAGEMYRNAVSSGSITGLDMCGNLWTGSTAARAQGVTGAPVLTFNNASAAGQAIAYHANTTRFANMSGNRIKLAFINHSHNESDAVDGDTYRASLASFISQITTVQADCGIVLIGQNPRVAPATTDSITAHRDRIGGVAAAAGLGRHGFVDVYTNFASSADISLLVDPDGIHVTTLGGSTWAELVETFYLAA